MSLVILCNSGIKCLEAKTAQRNKGLVKMKEAATVPLSVPLSVVLSGLGHRQHLGRAITALPNA